MLKDKKVGFGITGSFCSMDDMLYALQIIINLQCDVYVFISDSILKYDTRFNSSQELIEKIEKLTNHKIISDIVGAEVFGPKIPLDIMVVYPCSGNTLAKFANGINDNAVTMACKATLRNNKNIVLGIYTNDALSNSGKNIMQLLNTKNYYLVPMYQDDIIKKPFSMVADVKRLEKTIGFALNNKQVQPVFEGSKHD